MNDREFTVAAIALGAVVILGVGYVLIKDTKKEADNSVGSWISGIGGLIGGLGKAFGSSASKTDSESYDGSNEDDDSVWGDYYDGDYSGEWTDYSEI